MYHLHITRKIFAAVAVVLITGCASSSIPKTATFDSQSEHGLVLGSISHPGDRSSYKVFYSGLDNSVKGHVRSRRPFWRSGDIDRAGLHSEPFAIKLPAGNYEFYSWNVANKHRQVYPADDFSVKFSVQPGIGNYLGNFLFGPQSSNQLEGATANVSYNDEFERDMALLQRMYENVDFQGTSKGIAADLERASLGSAVATELAMSVYVFSSF